MKRILRHMLGAFVLFMLYCPLSSAQAIKTNIPLILTGNPNIGVEWTVGKQLSVNGDILWAPYLFKKNEEVFRTLIGSVDFRYYVNPDTYYVNDLWDGLYVGPYAMYGNFNIGLKEKDDNKQSIRRKGWGISGGVSTGYKMYLSKQFRIDFNIGLGYAHLQYDRFFLGGEYADDRYAIEKKKTKSYWGPTKVGVHLVYYIFR